MATHKNAVPVFRPEEKGLRKVFGELEAAIMEYLWAQGQGTVSEVHKDLTRQRESAYATVKTIMERLAEKGFLRRDRRQRAYVYTPTQSREAFGRQVSDAVMHWLVEDFGTTIAAHLLEETVRQCDLDDLDRLQKLIEDRRDADRQARRQT